ncbi:alpha/beta hydrolase family protein [Niastella sp. OAS944]|uniref:alpha/beta hydrolase family protein n=1 Tax=Niastella sp. OAS944 TaxID=2664089 RepID=UPI003488D6EA|nr:hypothetical protein [Chitinophagaceae bacterium OAS944]
MKSFIKNPISYLTCFILFSLCSVAQQQLSSVTEFKAPSKPNLDTSMFGKWPALGPKAVISNDGRYVAYTINNPLSYESTLFIQSLDHSFQKQFAGANESFFFCTDSRRLIFQRGDSLMFVTFDGGRVNSIGNVESFQVPVANVGEWIAYRLKGDENKLVLLNLMSGKTNSISFVTDYFFDKGGNTLVVKCSKRSGQGSVDQIQWMNLKDRIFHQIWERKQLGNSSFQISKFIYDDSGKQCAFTFNDSQGVQICYFKKGMDSAVLKVHNGSPGINAKMLVYSLHSFSKNGKYLFFYLQEKEKVKERLPNITYAQVNIWSYNDIEIQPAQRNDLGNLNTFLSVVTCLDNNSQVLQLQDEDDAPAHHLNYITGDYVVMTNNHRGKLPYWWSNCEKPSTYCISLIDGKKRLICEGARFGYFSPLGKYFIYWNSDSLAFMCFNMNTKMLNNITQSIPDKLTEDYVKRLEPQPVSSVVAAWYENDKSLIVYGKYDIWKIDPEGKNKFINLTHGYGRKHKVMLRLINGDDGQGIPSVYSDKSSLLLTGVSDLTKDNGFFIADLDGSHDPTLLTMGRYVYYKDFSHLLSGGASIGMKPIKANNAACWIIRRESANEYPNYFVTRDFKTFTAITDLHPQKQYNWLTSELITWKMFDGETNQGTLYKPENFNPQKKYPIIFQFYETRAERLNDFITPYYSMAEIDIPWFLSNGYLVFTPDVRFDIAAKTGKPFGEYTYNSVVSAAEFLSKMPFINGDKMAIHGASFGGAQASYLVTHTNIFAAACEAAGFTDPVSGYLKLSAKGLYDKFASRESTGGYVVGRTRYGATLWERPDLYIKNSAVLNVDKATSPLLIMHCPLDDNVRMEDGIALYLAFRRLGKRCWMLEYDEGGHAVQGNDAVDYNTRLTQFYNHYLKEEPPPLWMTKGIPAKLKGIETGFELDPQGSCGLDCKICKYKHYAHIN